MQEVPVIAPSELLEYLTEPAFYPHAPDSVEIVQTHASYVALAGQYVYKIKKSVNFGFLDFSTLEKRRHYCHEEVRLNRRLCSRIYEGVVSICRSSDGLRLVENGVEDGEVIEYAVKMHRLEAGYFLTDLIARHEDQSLINPVLDTLAAFYRRQQPQPDITVWGTEERLRISTDENFDQVNQFVGDVLPNVAFRAIRHYTDRFYYARADLLERRCREGCILDCHGDLRAEHIHLSTEGVCIYDCIEFNERFRYVDMANDIAFLAMDLDFLDRPQWAQFLVSEIAARMNDPDLLELEDFYKCYRAFVRGKVECMRAEEPEVIGSDRDESRQRAKRYFQLALRYATVGTAPTVLVVMGSVGTGKSTQAGLLSSMLGVPAFSSDELRKKAAGVPVYERGDASERARLYSGERTEETYSELLDHAGTCIASGRSVVLDATYGRKEHRDRLRRAFNVKDVPVRFIELHAGEAYVRRRLSRRSRSSQEVSDARLEDFDMLRARYEDPDEPLEADVTRLGSEGSRDDTASRLLTQLIESRLRS